ncbi:MAG TPA: FHA domain-containing protein [Steroidobacteraceae bacterium]|nr:FHA domain-containing protein [Steroidobacteraceae bacterium]
MGLNKQSGQEVDLDATDELPALDYPFPGEAQASTDVFPAPVFPAGMVELADSLRDVEQRLQRKIERVARLESELQQSADQARELRERMQLQESTAAARETALRDQLGEREALLEQLRDEQSTAQRSLVEMRGQLQSQLSVLVDAQQRLSQRDSENTHASRDAAEWRRRAERHYEELTTWQSFRSVSEAMLGEAERVLGEEEGRRAAELAATAARAQEVEAQLGAARADAARRIAELEEAVRGAVQSQQVQAESLRAARDEAGSLGRELAARDASIAGLRQQLTDAQGDASQRIEALEQSLLESEQDQAEQMDALLALTTQTVELRSGLEAREADARQLQQQLQELRTVEEKARKGAVVFEAQLRQIGALQTDLSAAEARIRELEQQLHKSADRVQRLESEAHASAALLANLQQNMDRLGRDDTASRLALKEVVPETVRVLVRQEGGADVVYRLGRRTTVGRTAENDIQVDTTFVSRHHAVLLSSADHCIVEDLNSTNGVLVNGRRVGRHILQDGDVVTFGKTEFRYQQRS